MRNPAVKVMTFVGTRPELIKLSRVIAELDASVAHVLVHTGQNFDYELNGIFFEQLGIRRPDEFLEIAAGTPMQGIANVLVRGDEVLERHRPDAVLLLGDTNSCLVAIAAKRRKIPVFHMEAGNRCFDDRVPEEINRRIVDHTSDVNLVYTEHARRYLLAEGLPPDRVIKTGSPMAEVIAHHAAGIEASDVVSRLGLERRRFIVVSAHREENVDVPRHLAQLIDGVNRLAERHAMPVVFSVHPRTRRRLDDAGLQLHPAVRESRPLGFLDYARLQRDSFCVVSDSGTLTEEAALLGFAAVMIRESHERPEGMDEGTVVMCGVDPDALERAVALVTRHAWRDGVRFPVPPDYATECVSLKVSRLILSYTDYVSRRVWLRRD